jgi:hypothetical protein|nr:MAG TPA: hypothetical protein [Caudoviricetes sp.]
MSDNEITASGKLPELGELEKSMIENFKARSIMEFQQKIEKDKEKMLKTINQASRGKKLVENIEQIQENQVQQIENQEEQIEFLKELARYQKEQIKELKDIFASLEDSVIVSKMIQQELQKEDKSALKDLVEKVGTAEVTAFLTGVIKSIVDMSKIF